MSNFSPPCAIILGPTASGKSDLAECFYKKAILLSADSMCVYKDLKIISAKPNLEYYGIDLCELNEDFSVGDWIKEFKKAQLAAAHSKKPLIIVGGSSFYLSALLKGLSPAVPRLDEFLDNETIANLMRQIDPEAKIDSNDTYRLQRWLEIYTHTKTVPSKWLAKNKQEPALKNALLYELIWDKNELNKRIELRSANMLKNGAIIECANALARLDELGANFAENKALNCIGAKQICEALIKIDPKYYLNASKKLSADTKTLNALLEAIIIKTRQYAKRQRTFNKSLNATKLDGKLKAQENANLIAKNLGINL